MHLGIEQTNHFCAAQSRTNMKLLLILGALLGLANAIPLRSLRDDVDEILALIPVADIKAVNAKYADDPELQRVVAYLRSDAFRAIIEAAVTTDEYVKAIKYLKNAGLDVDKVINFIRDFLNLRSNKVSELDSSDELVKSFHGWLNEIRALIPFAEIKALISHKMETSPDFQELVAKLKGDEFKTIVNAVIATTEYQALLDKGRDHGVPIDKWINAIHTWFGWDSK